MQQRIVTFALILASSALVANASVIITSPAGMTTESFNSSGADTSGDTISGGGFFNSGGEVMAFSSGATVTFNFVSPLASFGFDMGGDGYGATTDITAVTLSNSDGLTTTLPYVVATNSFYGISSATNFNRATVTFTTTDSADIKDFRLGPAAGVPEPATLALVAPLLLLGLAGLRLFKRAAR